MKYLNQEDFIKSVNTKPVYKEMIDLMAKEVVDFAREFHDDPKSISGWGHHYFCPDDGGRLIFDVHSPHGQKCEICGKVHSTPLFDTVWVYCYRNEAVMTVWKAALVYKYTKDSKYLDIVKKILGFYSDHYLEFELHNKEGKIYKTISEMEWGCGRIMPQGLNESIIIIRLLNALEIVKEEIGKEFLDSVYKNFFSNAVEMLMPQVDKIHNISCWKNSAIGLVGLFYNNKEMIDFVFEGKYSIYNQLKGGVTDNFFWYEGSIHYNYFTLEGMINLLLFSKFYNYDFDKQSEKTIEKMLIAGYNYAFNNHILPNPNDGWPNINLKTYSYVYTVAAKIFGINSEVGNLLKNIEGKDIERGLLPLSRPYYFNNDIPLERLAFLYDVDMKDYKVVITKSENFVRSQYAVLKNNLVNVFLKYGHNGPSHAHPDKMNIEVTVDKYTLTRDLSNAGYGNKFCNEWHRVTASHSTVVANGKNQISMENGETLEFSEDHIKAKVTNVYSIPKNIDINKMRTSMNGDEIIRYCVKNLNMSVEDATNAIKANRDLQSIVDEVVAKSPVIDYIRDIKINNEGFVDQFVVNSNMENTYDYFFHSEATLISKLELIDYDLGYNSNGYQHIKNVKKVNTKNKDINLEFNLGEYKLVANIDLSNIELIICDTYDNPITNIRKTFILRQKANNATFNVVWKIKE